MIDWIITTLRGKPELVIFLTLAKFNEGEYRKLGTAVRSLLDSHHEESKKGMNPA